MIKIQPKNKSLNTKERAIIAGELNKDFIDSKIIKNEFNLLKDYELEFLKSSYDLDSDAKLLSYCKDVKVLFFKNKCEFKIEEGFTATNGNFYRTNRDDQTNMIGQKGALSDDLSILQVPWKTEDKGYVMHTREDWLKIHQEAFKHKQMQLMKYDSLKKQIITTTTQDGLSAINWV